MARLILTGDVNLMNVTDPATPFRRVAPEFRAAAMVFSNLECCLYQPPRAHSFHNEGFFADPAIAADALRTAAVAAVGIANNVNYGDAAILNSIAALDRAGIGHTGAGENRAAAHAPSLSSAPDSALAFCSEARCTGRPIMRPARTIRASR